MKGFKLGVARGAVAVALVEMLMGTTALAQTTTQTEVAEANATVEEIVVTGSRRSGVRAQDSAVPVDLLRADALTSSGQLGVTQALRTLVPSFTYAETGGTIGSRLAKSATLRGLPAGDTLILVNGKRRTLFARPSFGTEWGRGQQPVDLNAIPQNAIERIEVLRDGASAQYGSDAIAGVVNIILRGDQEGGELNATAGQFYEGDGFTHNVNIWHNFKLLDDGFVNVSLDWSGTKHTYRDGPDNRQFYFAGDPREASVPQHHEAQGVYGQPRSRTYSAAVNAEKPLTDRLTAYAFGTFNNREYQVYSYYLRPQDDNNVRALFPNGQYTKSDYNHHSLDGAVGLRYDAGDLGQFDFSSQYGISDTEQLTHDATNSTFGIASPTDFFIGSYRQRQSSTQLDYVKETPVGYSAHPLAFSAGAAYRYEAWSATQGDVASYASGGVPIADGPNAGRFGTPGGGLGGIRPEDAGSFNRDVVSTYVGLEQKLTDQFQFGLAGRYEHYSDFGDSVTGKISARYDFIKQFGLRGSYSTAFRAPTVAQTNLSSTSQVWVYPVGQQAYLATTAFLPVTSRVAQAFGAAPLEPEKSKNASLGFVSSPIDNLNIAVDAYQVKITNGIAPIEGFVNSGATGAAVQAILNSVGATNISSVRFFANGLDTRTRGIDITSRYTHQVGDDGVLTASLGLNFNDRKVTRVKAAPASLAAVGLNLFGRLSRGYAEDWAPESKVAFGLNYATDSWGVNVDGVRYGKYKFTGSTATFDEDFGAQYVVNLSISHWVTADTKLTLGANNLFDSYPTQTKNLVAWPSAPINGGARYNNFNNYDLQAPEGGNGGFYYVRVTQKF